MTPRCAIAARIRESDKWRFRNDKNCLVWYGVCVFLVLFLLVETGAQDSGSPGGALRLGIAELPTPLNVAPDANTQMLLHQRRSNDLRFEALNALRHRQLAEEAAKILILASDVQAQLTPGSGHLPSVRTVREADVIEMLARDVHARMMLTVADGGNRAP